MKADLLMTLKKVNIIVLIRLFHWLLFGNYLFFMLTEDAPWSKPDFWPDVHWAAIHDNNSVYTYGEKYVNFMKRAMDASEMNLTDFFKKDGITAGD